MASLLEQLRAAAEHLDPQFQTSSNEIPGVLSALVYFTEHGDEFLKAAETGVDEVTKLLAPPAPEEPAAPASDVTSEESSLTDDALARRIADLEALQASRRATAGQTTVTHETGAPADPPATAATDAPPPVAPPAGNPPNLTGA